MITNKKVDLFKEDFNIMLNELSLKHGLSPKMGIITFNSDDMRFKVELFEIKKDELGNDIDPARTRFEKNCSYYNLLKSDYGRKLLLSNNQIATIYDIAPSKSKFPILCKTSDNKIYKLSVAGLRMKIYNFENIETL